jgi:hypothetical protein
VSFRRHLVRWEAEYEACGLAVVEVSGGDAEFAPSRRRLSRWVVTHPVLWDRGNATAKAYGITEWPSAFVIGPDGTVVWQGNPAAITRDKETEADFRELLQKQLRQAELARK